MGAPIAIVAEPGDDLSSAAQLAEEAASEKPKPPPSAEQPPEPPKAEPTPTPSASAPKEESRPELAQGERVFASPLAKKIALEKGVPLSKVKGSGPNGRILREDVEKYQPPAPAAPAPAAAAAATGAAPPGLANPFAVGDAPFAG